MMKKIVVCLIFLISMLDIYSQFDYREGYVVLNNNDTVYGLLDFKSDLSNSQFAYFKKDENSKFVKYTPDKISSYRFKNGKYYVSKQVELSKKAKLVFLEVLLYGEVNVYYAVIRDRVSDEVKDSKKGRYFVEKDERLVEINNDEFIVTGSKGSEYFKKTNQYKGVLKSFFADSPEFVRKVDYVAFNQKSLLKVTKEYHLETCSDKQCIDFTKIETNRKYTFGLNYTYSMAKVDFSTSIVEQEINKAPLNSRFSMGIIGSTNIDNDYRFWFGAKMNYLNQSISDRNSYEDYYTITGNYKSSYIVLDLGFKYYLLFTKLKPFVFAGVSVGGIISENYSIESEMRDIITSDYEKDRFLVTGVFTSFGADYMVNEKIWLGVSLDYRYNTVKLKSISRGFDFTISAGIKF